MWVSQLPHRHPLQPMLQKDPKVISRSIKAEAGETTQPSSAPAAFLLGKGRCPWRREVSGGQTRAHITQGALETDYLLSGGQPGRGPRLGGGGGDTLHNQIWAGVGKPQLWIPCCLILHCDLRKVALPLGNQLLSGMGQESSRATKSL